MNTHPGCFAPLTASVMHRVIFLWVVGDAVFRTQGATIGPVTAMRVYVSGYLEYRIDNPAALIDASKFTPEEFGLTGIDPKTWEQLDNALVTEVAKATSHGAPPGTTFLDNALQYSLEPPTE